ncbi:DEAD/DEAH box helicase [Laceyella tengchongensis]|jgi:ATP-dependent helicase IRC3
MKLRPYQEEAVQAVLQAPVNGITRPMIVLPTGMGKTVVFTAIAREMNTRTLLIAHREELLTQAKSKFLQIWPGTSVGIVQGRNDEHEAKVVVGSIQTLIQEKRLMKIGNDFGLIIVDEAHHAAAQSYLQVLEKLRAFENDGPLLLGVTATPNRGDGKGLDGAFQEIVYQKDILYGIQNGYLCDLKGIRCQLSVDFGRLKSKGGDIQASSSSRLLLEADAPKHAVKAYLKHASGRKGIIFTPTVEVAEQMAQAFNESGIPSAVVSGRMKADERKRVLRQLATGQIQMVANCGVLTEGFDQPDISCVMIARPTQSQALYIQMVGRATRLHPSKKDAVIIDLVGATDRHDLITMGSLYGTKDGETITLAQVRQEKEKDEQKEETHSPLDLDGELITEERELFKHSKFQWGEYNQMFYLRYGRGTIWLTQQLKEGADEWSVVDRDQEGQVEWVKSFATVQEAKKWVEEFYLYVKGSGAVAIAQKESDWRNEPATPKQKKFLRWWGVEFHPGLTKGEASRLITRVKQAKEIVIG